MPNGGPETFDGFLLKCQHRHQEDVQRDRRLEDSPELELLQKMLWSGELHRHVRAVRRRNPSAVLVGSGQKALTERGWYQNVFGK